MATKPVHPVVANLGRNLFIYNNIQTKQVVYSLTRSLKVLRLFTPFSEPLPVHCAY